MSKEPDQLPRFKSTQNWQDFLNNKALNGELIDGQELLAIRMRCYSEIEKIRKRPLIVYASRFIDNLPPNTPTSIDISDVEGFTDLVNSIEGSDSIDVLIHSGGGSPDATERLVGILRNRFREVHFLIPHSAYSAATMLALSGNSISMHPSGTLGPIDPQLDGIPARSIKRGFEKAKQTIIKEGPQSLSAYLPLIEKYSLHLLEICDDSEKLSKELVSDWLKEYMFNNDIDEDKLTEIVEYFSDYDTHLLHSRPLVLKKLQQFGLSLQLVDNDLKYLLWESYILINGFFSLTPFVKLFECRYGISWGRQIQVAQQAPAQNVQAEKTQHGAT